MGLQQPPPPSPVPPSVPSTSMPKLQAPLWRAALDGVGSPLGASWDGGRSPAASRAPSGALLCWPRSVPHFSHHGAAMSAVSMEEEQHPVPEQSPVPIFTFWEASGLCAGVCCVPSKPLGRGTLLSLGNASDVCVPQQGAGQLSCSVIAEKSERPSINSATEAAFDSLASGAQLGSASQPRR